MVRNKKLPGKKKIILLATLPLLLVGGASAYYLNNKNAPEAQPTDSTQAESEEINFSPPTEAEKKQTEEFKKNLETQSEQPQPTGKTVKPVITSYGIYESNVEVASRVPGTFEGGGTCTLKLTKGSKVVSKSRKAIQNVSEMSCGYITIPTSQLSSGTWSATVSYKSQELSGTSNAVNIRVP